MLGHNVVLCHCVRLGHSVIRTLTLLPHDDIPRCSVPGCDWSPATARGGSRLEQVLPVMGSPAGTHFVAKYSTVSEIRSHSILKLLFNR